MSEQQKHEMIFAGALPSGAEDWICPTCGRRMLISWEPKFKRTVLVSGNSDASHGGFKKNMQIEDFAVASSASASSHEYYEDVDLNIDENTLTPWKSWLDKKGFDDLWNGGSQ